MADRQGEIDSLVEQAIRQTPRASLVEGGTEWEFFCLEHPGSSDPHAYWNRKKGAWTCMKCGASGSTYDLAKLLGVKLPEQKKTKPDFRILAEYDYRDADGELIFQVVRMDPKDFRVRRPSGNPAKPWTWDRKGVTPQLYRLPEILKAGDTDWVLLCEGEKDVDRARREGYPFATTNPFGAQEETRTGRPGKPKWEPQYTESLRDKNVAICLDADNAGQNSARQIGLILRPHAKRVVTLSLPGLPIEKNGVRHKDLSDWFALGNTVDDLKALIEAAATAPEEPIPVADDQPDADDILRFAETDSGNAELFAHLFGQFCRFDHQRGRWLLWKGDWWGGDADGQLYRWATEAARKRAKAGTEIDNREAAKRTFLWSKASESAGKIEATLKLARAQPPIADPGKAWDTSPMLLGVANGVVNLTNGKLRRGRQEDRITVSNDIPFNEHARCPRWIQFLNEVFEDDAELIDWVHRAIGYSLTGSTREQVWFICYGKGANGKSTFLEVLQKALGDYAGNLPFTALMKGKEQAIPTDLASLPGKRLITASETQESAALNEARVKALTGGDTITARQLYEKQFSFVPELKLWVALNHLPAVTDTSDGFWRRVRIVGFNRQFGADARDPQLKDKLSDELPGILNWAVQGAVRWQEKGLEPPMKVMLPVLEYRNESDPLGDFISECCVTSPNAQVSAAAIYVAYSTWADKNGHRERDKMSNTAFGAKMAERYQKRHTRHGKTYFGIGLWTGDRDEVSGVTGTSSSRDGLEVVESSFLNDFSHEEVSQKPVTTRHTRHTPCLCLGRHGDGSDPCGGEEWWTQGDGVLHCPICHPIPEEDES